MIPVKTRKNLLWFGDNPIILLKHEADGDDVTAAGLFRVDYSPAGSGMAAFVVSDSPGQRDRHSKVFACYSDKPEVAEWIRGNVISTLPEFKRHDLSRIPIKTSSITISGDPREKWIASISAGGTAIRLVWAEIDVPFNLIVPIGAVPSIPYEINTIIFPAKKAEVLIDGRPAPGTVFPDRLGDQIHSTAFLALNETWYKAGT